MQQGSFDFSAPTKKDPSENKAEEPKVLSVSELNRMIRGQLEGQFRLIWLQGEISNFKAHTSGHFYFSLKDASAQVSAVMFKGFNSRLKFKPTEGLEVLVRGKVTVYEPRGNYQVFCELMEPVGAGALQKAFEQLKAKLQSEGLFDPAKKRSLPPYPKHVAVITSPTGAAVRDILNVLSRRHRGLQVTIIPVLVQGDQAPASIREGLRKANLLKDVEVIIVGRGGGSIEDLWGFNDEALARDIAASKIPVISAVGHEVDFTIADFVADLRAPTPSAAAEMVVKNVGDVQEKIQLLYRNLRQATLQILSGQKRNLNLISRRLVDPRRRLQDLIFRCDELSQRLEAAISRYIKTQGLQLQLLKRKLGDPKENLKAVRLHWTKQNQGLKNAIFLLIERKKSKLQEKTAVLDSLSPLRVVDRGYSIAKKNKEVVKSAKQLKVSDRIELTFAIGKAEVEVTKIFES